MTVFLGTLCCSVKQIEAPYVFDWEYGNALTHCMGFEPQLPTRGSLMGFLELWEEPGVYSRVTAGIAIRTYTWFSEVRIPV